MGNIESEIVAFDDAVPEGFQMQVFLPWPDYEWSARHLDSLRLGKQITEAYQLIKTSLLIREGHPHHPARRHFSDDGLIGALVEYTETAEWALHRRTGGTNIAAPKATYSLAAYEALIAGGELPDVPSALAGLDLGVHLDITPEWGERLIEEEAKSMASDDAPWGLGHPALHLSHQFNLCRKRPDIYSAIFGMRSWCIVEIKGLGELEWTWGCEENPIVESDVEPYMWPVTVEGERVFQVGRKSDREAYAHLFDVDPDLRTPLYVTPDQALARLERHHPIILDRYQDRVRAWRVDPEQEWFVEELYSGLLASRVQPAPDHLLHHVS